jgi:hypothetical protein
MPYVSPEGRRAPQAPRAYGEGEFSPSNAMGAGCSPSGTDDHLDTDPVTSIAGTWSEQAAGAVSPRTSDGAVVRFLRRHEYSM